MGDRLKGRVCVVTGSGQGMGRASAIEMARESGTVRARIKELAAMACDASPTHCFGPGFRLHLANAIALGVGRDAILETLDIAAAAPSHSGYGVSP